MNSNDDKTILDKSKQALDESIAGLDGQTLSSLNQARQKALSQKTGFLPVNFSWISASSLATLSVAIIVGSLYLSVPESNISTIDEAEFIASNEDIELMEDLEFVTWLIEQDNAG